MKLRSVIMTLHPQSVFRISRAQRTEVSNVFVAIGDDSHTGYGEASPNAFYGESAEAVKTQLDGVAPWLAKQHVQSVESIREVWHALNVRLSRAALCALDVSLWDLVAKRRGMSVAELAFGRGPEPVRSFATIGISAPDELSAKIQAMRGFPLIKVKSGRDPDADTVRGILAATSADLAIDANGAWVAQEIVARCAEIAGPRVLFLEQPLPPDRDPEMVGVLGRSPLPILADESCVTPKDVETLGGRFSGFNIKLVKCGGITPALAMLERGRALGLRTMVGCMLESSLLISAGSVIAQRTDYADLDGAWLLRDDPFDGVPFNRGILTPGDAPGLGVWPRVNVFGAH